MITNCQFLRNSVFLPLLWALRHSSHLIQFSVIGSMYVAATSAVRCVLNYECLSCYRTQTSWWRWFGTYFSSCTFRKFFALLPSYFFPLFLSTHSCKVNLRIFLNFFSYFFSFYCSSAFGKKWIMTTSTLPVRPPYVDLSGTGTERLWAFDRQMTMEWPIQHWWGRHVFRFLCWIHGSRSSSEK